MNRRCIVKRVPRTSPSRCPPPSADLRAHTAVLLTPPDAHSVAAESRSSIQKSVVQRVGLILDVMPAVAVGLPPLECPTSAFLCHRALVSLPSTPAAADSFLPIVLL